MEEKPIEIKQVSEREIWVGESRFYLGEDNIIYETVVGEVDEKMVRAMNDATNKLTDTVKGKVNVLVDLSRTGKATPEARRQARESLEIEGMGKIAFWGLHPVARVIASFFMGATRKKDIRFFKTREEALAWLKE